MTSAGLKTMRLLRHGPSPGAWNMAVDEVLLNQAEAQGENQLNPTILPAGCGSIAGKNQPFRSAIFKITPIISWFPQARTARL